MIISLIGFMGTGKSAVGKELAERLNYQHLDTDREIEKRTGRSIPEIFESEGEEYFRKLESELLKDILEDNGEIVLSTGGGIVLSPLNRKLLKEKSIPVLLEAGAREIYERVKNDTHRPLLRVSDPLAEIENLLAERKEYYHEFNLRIKTDGLEIEEIAEEILDRLEFLDEEGMRK